MRERVWLLLLLAVGGSLAAQTSYTIRAVAGTDFVGDNGPAVAALLSQAEGVAIDSRGAVYVADADDNRIRKITSDGIIRTAGGAWNHPYGLAIDRADNLYVAELGAARVRKLALDGTISIIAGGGSLIAGQGGDGGPATSVKLNAPRNVTFDSAGALFISDFGANQVLRVSPDGILTIFAGSGKAGFTGDGGSAALAQLSAPAGLAVDASGAVFIADSGNNRVRRVFRGAIGTFFNTTEPTGLALASNGLLYVAAAGYLGTTARAFPGVTAKDVAIDASGAVVFTTGPQVRKLTSAGVISTIAGSGAPRYFGGDGGPATSARLHAPSSIIVDSGGNVYIADTLNNRIRKIDSAGTITTLADQLNNPQGLALDAARNLYFADTLNGRVRKIDSTGVVSTVLDKLNAPTALAVDAGGNLYVADTGANRVLRVALSGAVSVITDALKPAGLALDHDGNLFISESSRVSKLATTGAVTTVASGLSNPRGLALTPDGALLIAESGAHRVRSLAVTGALSTIAGTGVPGNSGDDGFSVSAQLNSPTDIAVDVAGRIWIADTGNNRIRMLTPAAAIAPETQAPIVVLNAASLAAGAVAPGEIVTIFGSGFDPKQVQVLFDGASATIFYASDKQINALVPDHLAAATTTLSIIAGGAALGTATLNGAAAAPGIFTLASGSGQAAALNEDASYNNAANPAARGSIIVLFATGQGAAATNVELKIAGYTGDVLYAGPAPGFPGLMQINARVPAGFLPPGDQPVVLTIGGVSSQAGVTIAVR